MHFSLPAIRYSLLFLSLVIANTTTARTPGYQVRQQLFLEDSNMQPTGSVPGPGDLYVLTIPAADFMKIGIDKLVFKFIRTRNDQMTLHGWCANGVFGRTFSSQHQIELSPTAKVGLTYSDTMYFGDVILSRKDVRAIRKCIKNDKCKVTAIEFKPVVNGDPHLSYEITLIKTNKDCKCNNKSALATDTYYANPSPPKGFNNSRTDY